MPGPTRKSFSQSRSNVSRNHHVPSRAAPGPPGIPVSFSAASLFFTSSIKSSPAFPPCSRPSERQPEEHQLHRQPEELAASQPEASALHQLHTPVSAQQHQPAQAARRRQPAAAGPGLPEGPRPGRCRVRAQHKAAASERDGVRKRNETWWKCVTSTD